MVELHQQGTLRLDRTLFGLMEKLGGNGRGGPAVKPSTHNRVP